MKRSRIVLLTVVVALFAAGCGQGNVFELAVGQCFDSQTDTLVSDVPLKECDEPHDNEVFAVFDVTASDLPSVQTMNEGCLDRFEGAIGEPFETSIFGLAALTPSADSWEQGDREVICYGFIFGEPEKMTESILNSGK